ncbi:hypothetical protein B4U80_03412 [Leptotrombidium deliense]|uniref:Uncharacterized protein n=1 Tax=Leptotrombidium deliense TaxID=299467 RepID=A0A443QJT8_9ACAR|nr:hypothetical protein B4U80_03412 [Leptotrombidium deliense]
MVSFVITLSTNCELSKALQETVLPRRRFTKTLLQE